MRDYYKIAIVAKSGAGKTYSLRNLDPETTGFINVENKPLPFVNNFKFYITPKSYQETYQKIIEYGQNKDIKLIVIDSFSAYQEDALIQASSTKKGYDVWNEYNSQIRNLMQIIKRVPKDVIITAHYNLVQIDGGNSTEKRIGVKGNEHNVTGIEGNFTMVVFGDMKMTMDNKRNFIYKLLTSGNDTAKTPPYILDNLEGEEIPNDASLIIKALEPKEIIKKEK